ncbi:MAG: hypothetical protein ACT4QA_07315 [Panacagrimonas sp.]
MIATPTFVFLHLPKTGGTFLNEALIRFVPGSRQLGYHLPRSMIPSSLAQLPVLGFVRSPWSYYVSWYSFQYALARRNALFNVMSENGRLDFQGTVSNLLDLGAGSPLLDQLLPHMPAGYGNRGLNLPAFALASIRNSWKGFYGFLFDHLYAPSMPGVLRLARQERLRGDFLDALQRLETPISPELRAYVESDSARNTSPHGFYTSYYDDELRDKVAIRDRDVINAMGYRFGD